nr:hypothetical protein [Staphylococcus aureus]
MESKLSNIGYWRTLFSLLLDDKGHVITYMHEGGNGGGRHRIFTGKVCGAEYVRAARLTQF